MILLLALPLAACVGEAPAPLDATASVDDTVGSLIRVGWTQPAAGRVAVEYRVGQEEWRSTPPREVPAGTAEQLVVGVPYGESVTWRLTSEDGGTTADAVVETAALPEGLPVPQLVASTEPDPGTEWIFTSINEDTSASTVWWSFILDRQGRVVWALPTPAGAVSLAPRLSADGRALLIDRDTFWSLFDAGAGSTVARVGIDGTAEAVYPTPGLHHPFTQLPDGTLAWGALSLREEVLWTLTPDGVAAPLWSCGALLTSLGVGEGCGSNALYYDGLTDHFLFSLYTVDSVVEVDRASGATVDWYGALPGAWAFDPPASQFWWQHGANLTGTGTLLLSSHASPTGEEATMVREYARDPGARTLREVWSWGDAEADRVYSEDLGEAWRLPGGNTLHNYGTAPLLREVTPSGEVVWRVEWEGEHTLGRSTPFGDLYALVP